MTRPPRSPDLIVNFALTALRTDGSPKYVISGYRPIYKVKFDYWSSAHHEFIDASRVETGQQAHAEVWLLSPQAYPQTFWIGRRIEVAEGVRLIGVADVLQVLNPLLESSGPSTMDREIEIPGGITNAERWRKHCRKIRARASDFLEGRLGVIETARAMLPLARWTKVEEEPEFQLFRAIASETNDLPVGEVRAYWAPEALAREDVRIRAAEAQWNGRVRRAAAKLVERYHWTIAPADSSPCEE